MRRVRQRTIKPVFGNLLHHYGLRRINVRGQASAHKSMLLRAQPRQQVKIAVARPVPPAPPRGPICRLRIHYKRVAAEKIQRASITRPEFCNSYDCQ
ncbi:hypothetical protein [Hymenobacter sp. YC55]|uniref:hypothetical protein n=1 Tax=Hymenobacter sp. YC55 TaxID=3034019 RepID=UPI0023FA36B1|nr:hypothetical protein [Hymenobacter sp. YC55]MDF7815445.1 hypothetical protein [Hymenobacter sp. YC55]